MSARQEHDHPHSLEEASDRLRRSARILRRVARRMADAARRQQENTDRLRALNASLRRAVQRSRPRRFTYLDYLEFASAEEFRRFRTLPPITGAEVESVDWDRLAAALQAA